MHSRQQSDSRPGWGRRLLHPAIVFPAAVLLAVGTWWFAVRDPAETTTETSTTAPTDQVIQATSGSMDDTVSAEGTVAAADTEELSFSSSGTVTAVNVAAGDLVTTGQVLATIDSAELQAAVTSAESDVADAEAKLADDQDAGASDEQIAADISRIATANDSLTEATDALAGASLVASFDGTVASVGLTVGEELAGGQGGTTLTGTGTGSGGSSSSLGSSSSASGPMQSSAATSSSTTTGSGIQVVSTGRFTVDLSIDSSDIDRVEVGQSVDIAVTTSSASPSRGFGGPGGPGGFGGGGFGGAAQQRTGTEEGAQTTATSGATTTGTVTDVSRIADASSGVAAYAVTVEFSDDGEEFYVGTSVTADIVVAERTDVIQVPSRAVTTTDDGSTVTVSTDGTADATETRTVTVGLTADGMTEITDGLNAGESVVIGFPSRTGAGGSSAGPGQMPAGLPQLPQSNTDATGTGS